MTRKDVLTAAFPDADSDSPAPHYTRTGDAYRALMYSELVWPNALDLNLTVHQIDSSPT